MQLLAKTTIRTFLTFALLAPAAAFAGPIVYDIKDGSSGGFTAGWLHSATSNASGGYWMNGNIASISGEITIDWSSGAASGSVSTDAGDTDFGQGSGDWELEITGGSTTGTGIFAGGVDLLVSLDYDLFLNGSTTAKDSGTFYFADRNFTGQVNSANDSEIYLWGNNWLNKAGGSNVDRDIHIAAGGIAMGIDLYGAARPVPEPTVLFIFGTGLLGLALRRRLKLV